MEELPLGDAKDVLRLEWHLKSHARRLSLRSSRGRQRLSQLGQRPTVIAFEAQMHTVSPAPIGKVRGIQSRRWSSGPWVTTTPLGLPVEPEVYITYATSEPVACSPAGSAPGGDVTAAVALSVGTSMPSAEVKKTPKAPLPLAA